MRQAYETPWQRIGATFRKRAFKPVLIAAALLIALFLSRSIVFPECDGACLNNAGQGQSENRDMPVLPGVSGSELKPKPPDFDFSDHIVPDGLENPLPFSVGTERADRESATTCLAKAIYYEAANESDAGQAAVAQVVLNRVRHPLHPNSVCEVVSEGQELITGCQFTFMCDGSLLRKPSTRGWARAVAKARAFLNGETAPQVGMATHYHADYVYPYWADRLQRIAIVGTHVFYRWNSGLGRRRVFNQRYRGERMINDHEAIPNSADSDIVSPEPMPSRLPAGPGVSPDGLLAELEAEVAASPSGVPIADSEVSILKADDDTDAPQVDKSFRQLP